MLIQRSLPPGDEEALRRYRLQVKERLYRFNFVRSPDTIFQHLLTESIGAIDAVRERRAAGKTGRNLPNCPSRLRASAGSGEVKVSNGGLMYVSL
jgi:hypothetical protein